MSPPVRQHPDWSLLSLQSSLNYIPQNSWSEICKTHAPSAQLHFLSKKHSTLPCTPWLKCRTLSNDGLHILLSALAALGSEKLQCCYLPLAAGEETPLPPRFPMENSVQQTPDVGRKLFTENKGDLETDPHVYGRFIYNQGDLAGHTKMMA